MCKHTLKVLDVMWMHVYPCVEDSLRLSISEWRLADGWFVDGCGSLRDGLHTFGHGLGGPADGVYRERERAQNYKKIKKLFSAGMNIRSILFQAVLSCGAGRARHQRRWGEC